MKRLLRRFISGLIAIAIAIETPAFAMAAQAAEPPANAIMSQSQNARSNERVLLTTAQGVVDTNVTTPLLHAMAEQTGLSFADFVQISGIENPKRLNRLWATYFHFQQMVSSARSGHIEASYEHRDLAIVHIAILLDELHHVGAEYRSKVMEAAILSIIQLSFASVGAVNPVEKRRVDFIMSDFLQKIATADKDKKIKKAFAAKDPREATRALKLAGLYIVSAVGLTVLGMLNSVSTGAGINLLSMLGMGPWMFLAPGAMSRFRLRQGLANFSKNNLDQVIESYLRTEFDPKVVRAIQGRPALKNTGDTSEDFRDSQAMEEQIRAMNAGQLKTALTSTVSQFQNIQFFFDVLSENQELAEKIDRLIAGDAELAELAKAGREFRESYVRMLADDFGSKAGRVLDPELETLKAIRFARAETQTSASIEIPLKRAEMLAWEETRTRFSLPQNLELSELEERRYDKAIYLTAYDYFRRSYFRYQQMEVQGTSAGVVDIEQFKVRVKTEMNRLRAENFQVALKRYQALNPNRRTLRIRVAGGVQDVTISDLVTAEIEFRQKSILDRPIAESEPRLNDSKSSRYLDPVEDWGGRDFSLAREFYRLRPVAPRVMSHQLSVRLGADHSRILEISEASFSRLLFELGPKYAPLHDFDKHADRYLAEASRRDAVIADTGTFLDEVRDHDVRELERRLTGQIINRERNGRNSKTFTEELRDHAQVIGASSLANDLRWLGYGIHSDYWRVRDLEAEVIHEKVVASASDKKAKKELARFLREKKKFAEERGSREARIRKLIVTSGALMALAATLLAFPLTLNHGSSSGGHSGEPQSLELPAPNKAQNNSQKEQANQGSFFSLYVGLEKELPRYLNLPHKINLPTDLDNEERLAKKNQSSRLELEREVVDYMRKDLKNDPEGNLEHFAIWTERPIESDGSRLAVPSPSGFRVDKIRIVDKGSRSNGEVLYVADGDFNVFFDNRTGMSYVRLANDRSGRFNMQVRYKPIQHPPESGMTEWTVSWPEMAMVNADLRAIKATELSLNIENVMSRTERPSLEHLARAFAASGSYTYDAESWTFNWFSTNPFKESEKFLKDGSFFYQCTGSNILLAKYIQQYYQRTKQPIEVQNVGGFVIDPLARQISPIGHMHTIVFSKSTAYQYVELDATPFKMDSKYANRTPPTAVELQKKNALDVIFDDGLFRRKHKEFKQSPLDAGDRSAAHEAVVPNSPREEKREIYPRARRTRLAAAGKYPDGSHQVPAQTALSGREQLEKIADDLKEKIKHLRVSDPVLKNLGEQRLPGINDIALLNPVRHLLIGEIDAHDFLIQLLKQKLQIAPHRQLNKAEQELLQAKARDLTTESGGDIYRAIKVVVSELKAGFAAAIEREIRKGLGANSKRPVEYLYLMDSGFQSDMNRYYDFLLQHEFKYDTPAGHSSARSCEVLFMR
jgi:hypothetical protein